MLKHFSVALLMLLLVSGVVAAQEATTEAPTAAGHPVMRVLAHGLDLFEPELWRMASAEETDIDTHVSWRLREQDDNLFFYLEQPWNGDITPESLASYYTDTLFESLLVNYTPYLQTAVCSAGELRLYEFRSKRDGIPRILRYWVRPVNDSAALSVNGVFREGDVELLDAYSARLFPALPSCANR